MPGLLSSALKAEILKQYPQLFWTLTLGYPGGTKLYATQRVNSAALGSFEPRILRWGPIPRGSTDRGFGLEPVEMQVGVDDSDRSFRSLVAGQHGDAIEGSSALVRLASPNVAVADWCTAFTGLVDQFEFDTQTSYNLRCRIDDRPLRRKAPKDVIGQAVFPESDPSARANIAPLIYGTWDSGGNGGALPTLLVDIAGSRYLVCAGWAMSVDRVYVDGVQQASGFTITHPVIGGRQYTMVVFTTPPAGDVTVDAKGYGTLADGSGTLITGPADQLKHLLVNFVFGDYRSGAWLADATAPIDTTWFATAQTFLTDRGHKGAHYIAGAQRNGGEFVNEWCRGLQCRPFWTRAGKLAIRFEDHGITTVYVSEPHLKWDRDLGGFRLPYDTQQRIDRVTGSYLPNAVAGDFTHALEVRDPALLHEAPDSLDLLWSHAAAA